VEIFGGECSLYQTIWCSLPFYLVWEWRFSATPLFKSSKKLPIYISYGAVTLQNVITTSVQKPAGIWCSDLKKEANTRKS